MAILPCSRLLLVSIFLLCFMSATVSARSLPMESARAEMGREDMYTMKEERVRDRDDLVMMDYTPARKKSPIHN